MAPAFLITLVLRNRQPRLRPAGFFQLLLELSAGRAVAGLHDAVRHLLPGALAVRKKAALAQVSCAHSLCRGSPDIRWHSSALCLYHQLRNRVSTIVRSPFF